MFNILLVSRKQNFLKKVIVFSSTNHMYTFIFMMVRGRY